MTRVIGLTGNAAGGKTTVAERWRAAGVPVIDADRLGHAVLAEDPVAGAALVEAFGPDILGADGAIDRRALGRRAFATAEGRGRLNAIVHPPLLERLDAALVTARAAGHALVVVDAALIFEVGLDASLDEIVLVTAPRAARVARLQARGLDAARISQILAAQQPDDAKAAASDFVIVNDGSREALDAAADRVLAALRGGHGGPPSEGGHDE